MANIGKSMSNKAFPFLSLPLEIRRKVYLTMRTWPAQEHHTILCVSKQVYKESKESYDQRPLVCTNQLEFVRRVKETSPVVLNKIETLSINFLDDAFWDTGRCQLVNAVDENGFPVIEPHPEELQSVISCLRCLPSITELLISGTRKHRAREPVQPYLKSLLAWLGENYSQVESLTLNINPISLDAISAFSKLRTLSCYAYSHASPAQMIQVLDGLVRLEELTLRARSPKIQNIGLHRSFTGDVLRAMRPLKTLNLLDDDGSESEGEVNIYNHKPPHITSSIFAALCQKHYHTLQHLNVKFDGLFNHQVSQQILKGFVARATSLKTLLFNVIECDVDFLNYLPPSLKILDFTTQEVKLPAFGEASLAELQSKLPRLQEISFKVISIETGTSLFKFESKDLSRKKVRISAPDDNEVVFMLTSL